MKQALDLSNPMVNLLLQLVGAAGQAAGQAQAQVAPVVLSGPFAPIEMVVGKVKQRGKKDPVQFRVTVAALPTVDAFGRAFPTVEQLAAMKRSEILNYFTTSGKPAVRVCGFKFHLDTDPRHDGQSIYQTPIVAGDWRHWLGGWGPATRIDGGARFLHPKDLVTYMAKTGTPQERIVEMLKEQGITARLEQARVSEAPASTKKARGNKAPASA